MTTSATELNRAGHEKAQELRAPERKEVHVWQKRLEVSGAALERLGQWLEPEELERAQGFKFPVHCRRFVASRGMVREILSEYLGCGPAELRLDYSEFGKPFLVYPFEPALYFNVAHSEDRLVIAIAADRVGVDIEIPRPIPELEALSRQVYSANEIESWQRVPEGIKLHKFLSLWTRKEALLKGIGLGIANYLNEVSVFFEDEDPVILPRKLSSANWNVRTFREPDVIQSIAVPFQPVQITFKQ